MNPIVLEVHQDLENDGWQDEEGTIHYDDRIVTPFGAVGMLKTEYAEEDIVIVEAPQVILVRHGFPTAWSRDTEGVSMETTPFGASVMTITALNGTAKYQLDPRPVRWSDEDEDIPFYVAQLLSCDVVFDD